MSARTGLFSVGMPATRWFFGAVIVLCGVLVYSRTFGVPFLGDDGLAIVENLSLRDLSALDRVLSPPVGGGITVGGRPVLNLTLAINYAISGTAVWSYHLVNLLIHIGSALLLFGIMRRTLLKSRVSSGGLGENAAGGLALGIALVWLLHPLQTESVTYIVQRAESLMGFFFLLTLYAFIRSVDASASRIWAALSVGACFCGMGTKEVMVSAPLLVLLYDRTFVAGSFAEAWRTRRRFYPVLAATWLLLGFLVIDARGRGGSAGFGTAMSSWHYALTQCEAILLYLRLSVFPHPLVFDYGTSAVDHLGAVLPEFALLISLVAATGFALRRPSGPGLLGAAFFMVLAPSSSIVPVATQTMAEHRMYLPLAVLGIGGVLGLKALLGRRAGLALVVVVVALGAMTLARNELYRDKHALFQATVRDRPQNARAHFMLGSVLLESGRPAEAVACYRTAIKLWPDYVEAYHDLGSALVQTGQPGEALPYYERALRDHAIAKTHYAYASALAQLGRFDEAVGNYTQALRLQPDFAEALNNRGNLLLQAGRAPQAVADYEAALKLVPNYVEAHLNLAMALLGMGRRPEALAACQSAVRIRPDFATARWKLADVLVENGNLPAAVVEYREALRLDPGLVPAWYNLGRVLSQAGRPAEAVPVLEQAVKLDPRWALARHTLAVALANTGRLGEAIVQDEAALQLEPGLTEAAAHLTQVRERLRATGGNRPISSPR